MGESMKNSSYLPWWRKDTLMTRVDQLAKTSPHGVYAAYPKNPLTYDDGYREVTYSEFANAVNGIAHTIEKELGRGSNFETLAYIGPNDVRYPAVLLGAAKAGYRILLTSPRNSIAAQEYLYQATGCKTILSPTPQPPQVMAILEALKIKHVGIPSLDELLSQIYKQYPYHKTYEQAKNDPLAVVHTSGSTGMPKPLFWNNEFVAANIEQMHYEPPPGYESQDRMIQNNRVYITFPPFHGAALACLLFNAPSHGTVMIAPTSGAIPTGEGLLEALQHTQIDVAFLVPSIALDLAQNAKLLDDVSQRIQKILYCGGDLPQAIGDVIAARMPLYNQYGASEMGLTPQIWGGGRTMADWKYIEVHPEASSEMRHVTDSLYEYNIVRKAEGRHQPAAIASFPDLDAWPSRDLYVRHPTNPKLWRWQARVDDVIVFLNGEKTNPNSMEQHIVARNQDVARALVTGSQRFQASLLIQPVESGKKLTATERADFIERIWPSVEEANQVCPTHAKVAKSHILFTMPNKLMMVAGKGTIQRAGTIALFEKELDKLYADADTAAASDVGNIAAVTDIRDVEAVSEFIKATILQTTDIKTLDPEDNFFTLGMDSLQALLTLRRLRHGLGIEALALSTIYTNPSVASLSRAAVELSDSNSTLQEIQSQGTTAKMQQLLEKYKLAIDAIPQQASEVASSSEKGISVIITGSTGALGCQLLQTLLSKPAVAAVFCLNRATDGGRTLQASRLAARGLSTSLASDARVSYYHTDLANSSLGMDSAELKVIKQSVTHIIHAAWPVDFNLQLDAFEPQLKGLVNILALAASSSAKVKVMFISSISSVMSYHTVEGTTPEAIVSDLNAAGPIGYAQSKLVSELLLAHANERLSESVVELAFARVGQVAGSIGKPAPDAKNIVTWNSAEWFPSLVLSSVHVGALPDTFGAMGRIDWVPMDVLSEILMELTLSSPTSQESAFKLQSYHPHNPQPTSWSFVRAAVESEIKALTGKSLEAVTLEEWLKRVQKSIETGAVDEMGAGRVKAIKDKDLVELLKKNPAAKLLEWYRDTLGSEKAGNVLETKKTCEQSETLRKLEGVQEAWVKKWVREWLTSANVIA